MTPFEYIIVLISIILGLGITTILTGLAEYIKHASLFNIYPPHLIWIALVFVLHVQEWWENYSLMSIVAWRLPVFLFILLYPINLYVLAHLLFPSDIRNEQDSKAFYLANYSRLFISAIILDVLSVIHNLTISGLKLKDQVPQALVFVILTAILISKTKKESVHYAIALLLMLMLVTVLILTQNSFLIS